MNRSGLIENVVAKTGLRTDVVEKVVELFFSRIAQTLAAGERVEIRGFGVLSVKEYGAYQGRNPRTGEPLPVAPKRLPVWRAGLELRRRVTERTATRPLISGRGLQAHRSASRQAGLQPGLQAKHQN